LSQAQIQASDWQGAARVYITGRRKAELEEATRALGERAVAVTADVTRPADMDRLYELIKREAGHLDIVFANAGYAAPAPLGGLHRVRVQSYYSMQRPRRMLILRRQRRPRPNQSKNVRIFNEISR
jgi:NAD(P)-dependent dehydrogenase (short-subunit alcohol dehydrogenase family)